MPSPKEKEARILTILGIIMLLAVGSLYWYVDDNRFDKFALVVMTLCSILVGVGAAKTFAIKYGKEP
jgi:hypothetical protein